MNTMSRSKVLKVNMPAILRNVVTSWLWEHKSFEDHLRAYERHWREGCAGMDADISIDEMMRQIRAACKKFSIDWVFADKMTTAMRETCVRPAYKTNKAYIRAEYETPGVEDVAALQTAMRAALA